MENTIIIKEDGLAINSAIHVDYALVVTDFGGEREVQTIDGDMTGEVFDEPITIELRASRESESGGGGVEADVLISTFYELEEACVALQTLVSAIKDKEEIFDVRDYNSNV